MNSLLYYLGLGWLVFAAIVAALFLLSAQVPLAGFVARLLVSWACLMICAFYGVVASIVLRCVGYGGLSQWTVARSFKWTMRLALGVQFVIDGEENLTTRPAVFISNHQTELDVLMLGAIFPPYCSVTAKKSLKFVPLLGWFMALSKSVFIDRGNRENARIAFDGAARQMNAERQSVFIFPEGTRSYTTKAEMLPFKKGAFHLAVQAKVPIVPVVVANYSNILHVQSRKFISGKIPVKVLPPISTEKLTADDVSELTNSTRDMMLKELVQLTDAARAQGAAAPASKASPIDSQNAVKASGVDRKTRSKS